MSNLKGNKVFSIPFDRTYWVVPGKFLAGCYPGSNNEKRAYQKLRGLVIHGIRHMISLMEPDETDWNNTPFASYEEQMTKIAASIGNSIIFDWMSIIDNDIPTRPFMSKILDAIDHSIENGNPVYTHCWGGRGRTGTVVGCYLARHGFATGEKVLDLLQELRKNAEDSSQVSPQTTAQFNIVRNWMKGE
jgi:protein tyrosine/serine phosphatase